MTMPRLRIVHPDEQLPPLEANRDRLVALAAAAETCQRMAREVLELVDCDGPQGELYDGLLAACRVDEMGTPAAIARLAEELLRT